MIPNITVNAIITGFGIAIQHNNIPAKLNGKDGKTGSTTPIKPNICNTKLHTRRIMSMVVI